jgi:hypothetical protein
MVRKKKSEDKPRDDSGTNPVALLDAALAAWLALPVGQPELVLRTGNPCFADVRAEAGRIIAAIQQHAPVVAALAEQHGIDATELWLFLLADDARTDDGARAARVIVARLRARMAATPPPPDDTFRLNNTHQKILELVQHTPLSGNVIARRVSRDYDYLRKVLAALVRGGHLEKTERGYKTLRTS